MFARIFCIYSTKYFSTHSNLLRITKVNFFSKRKCVWSCGQCFTQPVLSFIETEEGKMRNRERKRKEERKMEIIFNFDTNSEQMQSSQIWHGSFHPSCHISFASEISTAFFWLWLIVQFNWEKLTVFVSAKISTSFIADPKMVVKSKILSKLITVNTCYCIFW